MTQSPIPVPSDCVASDFRPFAVTAYRGQVLVGAVCSAESMVSGTAPKGDSTELQAYVFSYTDSNGFATTPVLQIPLNYTRPCANNAKNSQCRTTNPAAWTAWQPTLPTGATFVTDPQPELTSLAFDNGDLILGIRDRFADQLGVGTPSPSGGSTLYSGVSAGDTLRMSKYCWHYQCRLDSGK